jgi:small-conductance mechanosensitive channel
VIGVMLALTQGSWAPDIISGLIIMNSDFLDEGDVVSLNNGELVAQVFRTKLFHTELLNLVNNNRILLNNANLRSKTIQNLSKFASAKGYREKLSFKIGYDDKPADVRAMFQRAMDAALKDEAIGIEENHDMEVRVLETGDYAIEWGVFYYTKDMKKMIRTRQLFSELILQESLACGISLATPDLYQRVSDAPAIAPAFKINDNPSNFLENT